MKLPHLIGAVFCLALAPLASAAEKSDFSVLVYSKTNGFRHTDAIEAGRAFFTEQGQTRNFAVVCSENPADFSPENLKKYHAIVLLNTTGAFLADKGGALDEAQQSALESRKTAFATWVRDGGAVVGLHSATDGFHEKGNEWPEFWKIIGGSFRYHPHHQTCTLEVLEKEKNGPAASFVKGGEWVCFDEWYFFKNLQRDNRVVMRVKSGTCQVGDNADTACYYEDGEKSPDHPFVWYRTYGKGRIFYTSRGHYGKAFAEPEYTRHVLAGLYTVLGKKAP